MRIIFKVFDSCTQKGVLKGYFQDKKYVFVILSDSIMAQFGISRTAAEPE